MDVDLKEFFDRVNHDILNAFAQVVAHDAGVTLILGDTKADPPVNGAEGKMIHVRRLINCGNSIHNHPELYCNL